MIVVGQEFVQTGQQVEAVSGPDINVDEITRRTR